MLYRRILFLSFIGSIIIFITGITLMPPTGGTIPLNQTVEQYQQEQRTAILNSNGFKLAMAGVAIASLTLILLARNYVLEDQSEARNIQVVPYPPVRQEPRVLNLNSIKRDAPIQVVTTHELRPPIMALAPRMPIPPIYPISQFRTFKYPPPYDAFNKK
jgi:hypothetical protein